MVRAGVMGAILVLLGAVCSWGANSPQVDLEHPADVYRPAEFIVRSAATNPDEGVSYNAVRFDITLEFQEPFVQTDSAEVFTITHVNGDENTQGINDTFVWEDGAFVGYWGPETGFEMGSGYDEDTEFTVQMVDEGTAPLGTYTLTVELVNVYADPDVVLASAQKTFHLTADTLHVGPGEPWDFQFNTIQSAIDAAQPGDSVFVADGEYDEALTIDTSLTLQAGSSPVLDFSDRAALGLDKADGAIEISAPDVTIEGFEIIGYDMTDEDWGDQRSTANFPTIKALSGADGLAVIGNDFVIEEGAANAALLIAEDDIADVGFLDNTVTGYAGGVTARAKNTDNLLVEGNTFDIPIIEGTHPDTGKDEGIGIGVQLWHGDNLQIFGNTFTGSFDEATGDYEEEGSLCNHYAVVSWTTFFIGVEGYPEIDGKLFIEDNQMTNLYLGIGSLAAGGGGEIKENTIEGNEIGIQLGQVSDVYATAPAEGLAITNNDILNNTIAIWVQDFVEDGIHATSNNITDNTDYGILNETPYVFDAACNWWGHKSGPSGEGFGTGDAVSENVDFIGWLDAPYPDGECVGGPSITLDLPDHLVRGVDGWTEFSSHTENLEPAVSWEGVHYKLTVHGPEALTENDLDLDYYDEVTDAWQALPWSEDEGALVTWLGPPEGFDLEVDWDVTTMFRARAGEDAPEGEYAVTVELVFANPGGPIASAEGTFDVLPAPTISSENFPFALNPSGAFRHFDLAVDNEGGADYSEVLLAFRLEGPQALTPDMFRVQYRKNGTWIDVGFHEHEGDLVGLWCGGEGFPMEPGYEDTIEMRAKANTNAALGEYLFSSELAYIGVSPAWLLASFGGEFEVTDAEIPYDKHFDPGLHFVSVPVVPEDNVPETVFQSVLNAGMPLVLKEWVIDSSYHEPTAVDPGRGYWLWLSKGLNIDVAGDAPMDVYTVALPLAGWHMVSTPRWQVAWADVEFTDGDDTLSLNEAIGAGWIEPFAFYYDASDEEYRAIELPGTAAGIDPWRGYWLKTRVPDLSMHIPLGEEPYIPSTPAVHLKLAEVPARLTPPPAPNVSELSAGLLTAVGYPNPVTGAQATFRVAGLPAESVRATVLDLGGRAVWQSQGAGNQLSWDLTDSAGRTVANGVYLYMLEAKVGGRWLPAGTDRLLITR